jgi:hypothetical protein
VERRSQRIGQLRRRLGADLWECKGRQPASYNMSASPPKESNVEPAPQTPDDESMSRDPDAQQLGLAGYEFEVKEQDRWLPIANGRSIFHPPVTVTPTVRFP